MRVSSADTHTLLYLGFFEVQFMKRFGSIQRGGILNSPARAFTSEVHNQRRRRETQFSDSRQLSFTKFTEELLTKAERQLVTSQISGIQASTKQVDEDMRRGDKRLGEFSFNAISL